MKSITIILLIYLLTFSTYAQQVNYNWRLGASIGYTNYYGDLSPYEIDGLGNLSNIFKLFTYNKNYYSKPSVQLSLERRITPTTGLMIQYGQYQFGMSDRFVQPDGSLDIEVPNFNRALNFRTTLEDIGLSLVFKADNGKLLKDKSLISPYLTLGAGWMWFDVRGDLLDENDSPYDYSAASITNDGTFETDLAKIETESKGNYDPSGLYSSLGIGFRIRLSNKFELFVQSDFKHVFTDYLDDVSGQYKEEYPSNFEAYTAKPGTNSVNADNPIRGNSNGQKDWYIYHGAGIKLSFGSARSHFRAPAIASNYEVIPFQRPMEESSKEREIRAGESKTSPVTNNYYTFLNWPTPPHWDHIKHQIAMLLLDMEIAEQYRLLEQVKSEQAETEKNLQAFRITGKELHPDSLAKNSERKYLLDISLEKRDSLSQEAMEIQTKILALERQKSLLPAPQDGDSSVFDWKYNLGLPITMQNGQLAEDTTGRTFVLKQGLPITESLVPQADSTSKTSIEEEAIAAVPPVVAPISEEKPQDQSKTQAPKQAVLPLKDDEKRNEETLDLQPEPQEIEVKEKKRKWWLPIPIIFPRLNKKKDDNKKEQDVISEEISPEGAEWYDHISQEEYETYYLPAIALGMTIAGIPASESTVLPETIGRVEAGQEPDSASIQEIPLPSPIPILRDTVYIEKNESTILLPTKTVVYFELNQQQLSFAEKDKLMLLASYLIEQPESKILLEGFADNTGKLSYNLKLIEARTNEVKRLLEEEFGISPERIETRIGGQIVRNTSKNIPNKMDRRVELTIIYE